MKVVIACFSVMPCGMSRKEVLIFVQSRHRLFQRDALRPVARDAAWDAARESSSLVSA